ncbi:hypothetical protein MBLNU13_g01153t3 [Cladosporium sp. NU13]
MTDKGARVYSNPTVYDSHHKDFESKGVPSGQAAWVERARAVAAILAQDAPQRDIDNKSPAAEISLLKSSGLLKVLGPKEYGGGGEAWDTGYKVIREVAKGDGSIGMLLGYHLLWSTTANVVGTEHQAKNVQKVLVEQNLFVGGAVNPRDSDLKITSEGDEIVFNGAKNFNTGGVVSDLTVLEGVLEGTEDHIFTFVNTKQDGIQFAHNWDNVGLRLSESGGVRIDNVRVPWTDALGWDATTKRPISDVLGIPFATLLLPTIQAVFSNFYLGIAQGALDAAAAYTVKSTRAWPFGGDNKDRATEEWYILERYGGWHSQLLAADALLDRVGNEVATVYREGGQHGSTLLSDITNGSTPASAHRSTITAARRGELAALVASGKVISTDTGLAVTSGIFEVLGSRATGKKYGFDRFWRDVRTHTLHDPVAYKRREVGSWKLLGERPEPTWYT